jgi:hypothetical protein
MIVNGVALKAHSAPGKVENTKAKGVFGVENADCSHGCSPRDKIMESPPFALANYSGCLDAGGPCSLPSDAMVNLEKNEIREAGERE